MICPQELVWGNVSISKLGPSSPCAGLKFFHSADRCNCGNHKAPDPGSLDNTRKSWVQFESNCQLKLRIS